MTHDEVRGLLPAYAAGVLEDASCDLVRAHLAEGCRECLSDVFSRPFGLPLTPASEPPPPPPAPTGAGGRLALLAGALVLALLAVAAPIIARRSEPPPDLARTLSQMREQRASLALRLSALEHSAASAKAASREAQETRSAMADMAQQLEEARLRIHALKREMRRQDTDFREKRQSMEAVIARLATHVPSASGTLALGGRTGCDRIQGAARGICSAFCNLHCDRVSGPECEPLRARYESLSGTRVPPCTTAVGSGALFPCAESHLDLWSFAVRRGRQYTVTAETVGAATAGDLCLVGSCQGLDVFAGDDELPCRAAPGFGCPRATFTAPADATCVVAVTICSPGCGESRSARYELTAEGAESLVLIADDVSAATGEPADTF